MSIRDVMRGRWTDALLRYGVEERLLTGKHCECPLCGGKDRFRYTDLEGDGRYYCNGCGAGDGMTLLMRVTGREFKDLAGELEPSEYKTAEKKIVDHTGLLDRIKSGLQPLSSGDGLVRRYLAKRNIVDFDDRWIRFSPRTYQWVEKTTLPAMVVAMRDAAGAVKGYHITYLNDDATKHSRLYTPGETGECSLWLSKPKPVIAIAEGIESAMSVKAQFGHDCWATGDAGRMAKFIPPEGTLAMLIYADNDQNFTGQAAAYSLARRLKQHNPDLVVEVHVPELQGDDYNDMLMREQP